MILVQRRVHRRDQPLAERIVQRFVDRPRVTPRRAAAVAIDRDRRLKAAILLIAADVGEHGRLPQPCREERRPVVQVVEIVGLERELVLRVRRSAADADVLDGLEEQRWPSARCRTAAADARSPRPRMLLPPPAA